MQYLPRPQFLHRLLLHEITSLSPCSSILLSQPHSTWKYVPCDGDFAAAIRSGAFRTPDMQGLPGETCLIIMSNGCVAFCSLSNHFLLQNVHRASEGVPSSTEGRDRLNTLECGSQQTWKWNQKPRKKTDCYFYLLVARCRRSCQTYVHIQLKDAPFRS